MIRVKMTENGVEMHGHAGHGKNGQDLVCAAISALTCSLINSLNALAEEKIEAVVASGSTAIRWQKLSDKGKLLVDSWFLAMMSINDKYNCIEIT